MRTKLPVEVTVTAVCIGGMFVVAGIGLSFFLLTAWIGRWTKFGPLLVFSLLPVLISIGPVVLGWAMFCLPKRADIWKAGLFIVSVSGGWCLMGILLFNLPIHSELAWVLPSLLFALIGLLIIYRLWASHSVALLEKL